MKFSRSSVDGPGVPTIGGSHEKLGKLKSPRKHVSKSSLPLVYSCTASRQALKSVRGAEGGL